MMRKQFRLVAVAAVLILGAGALATRAARAALPDRLSDAEYWKLVGDISEPGGFFRITDNYTSNENEVGQIVTALRERPVKGGVYMGVGPEQNFSYIAAARPAMAFVCDIRRQAVIQHLMFKAYFEMAADRAEFISLLFGKPRPAGLDTNTPIQQIWNAFFAVQTDPALAAKNAARVVERLTRTHGFTLTGDESGQLHTLLDAFVSFGPSITTRGAGGGGRGSVTFADLTGWSTDAAGLPQSFLSTDDNFRFVKTMHEHNLIVPVSGDFGGPKAIRAIGEYVRKQGGVINAFYLSNVEQYLFQDGKDRAFYDNVATLPLTPASVFIRPYAMRSRVSNPTQPLCGISAFLSAVTAGRVSTNNDALACVR